MRHFIFFFSWISNMLCFLGSNWLQVSISSCKGLVLNRWEAIVWTIDGLVYRHILASLFYYFSDKSFAGWVQLSAEAVCQGWGLLKLRSLISPQANFSILPKYLLDYLHHMHIWQVSPQLSCGNTWQIWTWYTISNMYFGDAEKLVK